MTWNARVSALVLVILVGLPVSSTVCAFQCQPAANTASTSSAHHADSACAESSPASAAVTLIGGTGHDCRSHTLAEQPPATLSPESLSSALTTNAMPALVETAAGRALLDRRPPLDHATPRGTPPLISQSIVLRV